MPRDVPVGNGRLLCSFDPEYHLTDVFFPLVGMESQTDGHTCRLGVYHRGRFAWFPDGGFRNLSVGYRDDTLVTEVRAEHADLGLRITISDAVDFHEPVLVRRLQVQAADPQDHEEVRLFFHHDFHLLETAVGDCAVYDPDLRAVVHFKDARYALVGARTPRGAGVDQYAIGLKEVAGYQGTWRDAEDGHLEGNPVAQGAIDSTVAVHVFPGQTAWLWLAFGETWEEVARLHALVLDKGPATLLERTAAYWRLWVQQHPADLGDLGEAAERAYRRSLLLARTHVGPGGAVVAATDWDIVRFGHDTYNYVWPRDASFVVDALGRAGYTSLAREYWAFCAQTMAPEGYMQHKYNPDGTLGSTWHPRVMAGRKILPIQEDETGLVLWALWRHFARTRDVEEVKPLYRPLVMRAARFLAEYRDRTTGLPQPSFDLWEERRGIHTFTVGTVVAGLEAAARFALAFGETDECQTLRRVAEEVRTAMRTHLVDPHTGRLARTAEVDPDTDRIVGLDVRADASLLGLSVLEDVFPPDDPLLVRTVDQVAQRLQVPGPVGGLARYEEDMYQRALADPALPGNPWFITTLWHAEALLLRAQTQEELAAPRRLILWAVEHALPSGVMAEQVHPVTHAPLSVSPLTWSHAAFLSACLTYGARHRALARR